MNCARAKEAVRVAETVRTAGTILTLVLLLMLSACFWSVRPDGKNCYRVVQIDTDGAILLDGAGVVRLAGIRTPYPETDPLQEAFVIELRRIIQPSSPLRPWVVYVQWPKSGDRTHAYLGVETKIPGTTAEGSMVSAGLACVDLQNVDAERREDLLSTQALAQRARRGIWSPDRAAPASDPTQSTASIRTD